MNVKVRLALYVLLKYKHVNLSTTPPFEEIRTGVFTHGSSTGIRTQSEFVMQKNAMNDKEAN